MIQHVVETQKQNLAFLVFKVFSWLCGNFEMEEV